MVVELQDPLVALRGVGPVHLRWVAVRRWVVDPVSPYPVRDLLVLVVGLAVALVAAQVVDLVVDLAVDLEALVVAQVVVARHVARVVVVVAVKNSNLWTCRPTRLMMLRCPTARWSSSVPVQP